MEKVKIDNRIFAAMKDEVSKEIYKNRIAYSNGSNESMEQIIRMMKYGDDLIRFMDNHKANLYIFGAGMLGQDLAYTWGTKYKFQAFIDNDNTKIGKRLMDIPIIPLCEVKDREHAAIIIMTKFTWNEIADQLYDNGFGYNQIFNLGEIYRQHNTNQYFDLEYLKISDGEVFVDCGVLDGETSLNFNKRYGSHIKKIWMFEPDQENVNKCRKNFENLHIDYEIVEKGVWSSSTRLCFNSLGNGCSCIDENGKDYIDTVTLDEALRGYHPTYIKMDIEGAELEALKGAGEIIRRNYPKLAISVYHKPEDIDTIPRLLLDYNPDYRLYLRHYSLMSSETILYAL